MKRFLILWIVFLSGAIFSFQLARAEENIPKMLSIGTHPSGTFVFTQGAAAAKVITDHAKIRATVKPMSGPVAWFPYMDRGEVDLGILNMWDAEKGYLGESMYGKLSNEKGFSIRLICPTITNKIGMVVIKDSSIKNIPDLKGKRVAGNYPTPSLQLQAEALLANGNLSWEDIVAVTVNNPGQDTSMLMAGRADCTGSTALGQPQIEELNTKKGARFLPLDPSPEATARMRKFFPGFMAKVKPGPGATGIQEEQFLWGYDMYLIAGSKLSDEAAYLITKALWENHKELEAIHKNLVEWESKRFVSKLATIPYHPGAVRFYKEKGVWDTEMENLQKSLLNKK